MKTKEELNALKEELETLSRKLSELTEEELTQVSGGVVPLVHANGQPALEFGVPEPIEDYHWVIEHPAL